VCDGEQEFDRVQLSLSTGNAVTIHGINLGDVRDGLPVS
jgi:hypothetical protein